MSVGRLTNELTQKIFKKNFKKKLYNPKIIPTFVPMKRFEPKPGETWILAKARHRSFIASMTSIEEAKIVDNQSIISKIKFFIKNKLHI